MKGGSESWREGRGGEGDELRDNHYKEMEGEGGGGGRGGREVSRPQ